MSDLRVFCIDDDLDDIELLHDILRDLDQPNCLFRNIDNLIEFLENPPPAPSIIFIDVNMPIRNGVEVLKMIRENDKFIEIPIVMVTTSASPTVMKEAQTRGANMFLIKPSSYDGLKSAIFEIINIDWKNFDSQSEQFLYKVN